MAKIKGTHNLDEVVASAPVYGMHRTGNLNADTWANRIQHARSTPKEDFEQLIKDRQDHARILTKALRFQAEIGAAISTAHEDALLTWRPCSAGWRTLERPSALVQIAAEPTLDADDAQTLVLAYLTTADWSCSPQRPHTPATVLAIDIILFGNVLGLETTRTRPDLVAAITKIKGSLDKIMKTWDRASAPAALAQRMFRPSNVQVLDLTGRPAAWTVHTPMFWSTWSHRLAVSLVKPRGRLTPSALLSCWQRSLSSRDRQACHVIDCAPRLSPGTLRFLPSAGHFLCRLLSDLSDVSCFWADGGSIFDFSRFLK